MKPTPTDRNSFYVGLYRPRMKVYTAAPGIEPRTADGAFFSGGRLALFQTPTLTYTDTESGHNLDGRRVPR